MKTRALVRIAVVVSLVVAMLVPALSSPARTIKVPMTIARTALLTAATPTERLQILPTHIAFSWRGDDDTGVRYRTRSLAGGYSRWKRAPEAHDAERGDRHYSAVLTVDRPVLVEYEAVQPRWTRMSSVTLDYMNSADGPLRTVRIPAVADAAATTPHIVTRAEWGADESLKRTRGGCKRKFYDVQQLFVHHTAGSNYDSDPAATMRSIYWYHTQRQGWCDIGYNFVIARDGTIFEGRWARKYAPWEVHSSENLVQRAVAGAHVSGYNSGSVGVSVMGNFSRIRPPAAARASLVGLLAWEADRHDLDPQSSHLYVNPDTGATRWLKVIAGHRNAGFTECPGNYLYKALRRIREETATVVGEGRAATTLTLSASPASVEAGATVNLVGRLTDVGGTSLATRTVTIYQRPKRGTWSIGANVLTHVDGSFKATLNPTVTTVVRAVYDGDPQTWDSQSRNVKILVTPAATASPTASPSSSSS